MVTIFENIYTDEPHYITVQNALNRIKTGKSKNRIEEIRRTLDKNKADGLKRNLPSICFSGKFKPERKDESLIEHSGFMVLDFDNVNDVSERAAELMQSEFNYGMWLSPRGNGLKMLVKIADGNKHRLHFAALQADFPDADKSGVNVSRVCYESYDPNIHINPKSKVYTKYRETEIIETKEVVGDNYVIFQNLLKWLSNRNDAFASGERNFFIFKLASACCRFGLSEDISTNLILREYPTSNDFTESECRKAIKSGFKANKQKAGSAIFEKDILIEKSSKKEVEIDPAVFDETIKPKDVVYGIDVKEKALEIYKNGYEHVNGIGIDDLDKLYKPRRGEITLITGHGNYGKSQFKKWHQILRAVLYDQKFATFPPEDYPIQHFYHDLTEILLGADCSARNPHKPNIEIYNNAYDFVSAHFFYIYPVSFAPTPDYIKERFLELIIKENVTEVDIDPFNQLTNDYGKSGGRSDKYLESFLSDFGRFCQINNVHGIIIAHPIKMVMGKDGNYPCPNVYDIADGAMWNNKMDNILMYHRPFMQTDPENPCAEFHSKKIRNQKIVGKKGFTVFEYIRTTRRFEFNGTDYLAKAIRDKGLNFKKEQSVLQYGISNDLEEAPF